MAFRFRLEKVLSVRRIEEDAARLRHKEAANRLAEARRVCETLEGRRARCERELDDLKRRDELSGENLHLYGLHRAGLRRALAGARVEEVEAEAAEGRARDELIEAHRAREALVRLREREEAAWRQREKQREARSVDEMAVSRHRSREEGTHGP